MLQSENLAIYLNFLGHGNPDSKIWFMGIEEGGDIGNEPEIKATINYRKGKDHGYLNDTSQNTQVWGIIARLMKTVMPDLDPNSMLSEGKAAFFLANLFPLPRPTVDSDILAAYEQWFGREIQDYNQYLSMVHTQRYPKLFQKWVNAKPNLTICFGSSHHNEFMHALRLGNSSFESKSDDTIWYFPAEKVLLTPFFNYRFIRAGAMNYIADAIQTAWPAGS